MSTQLKPRGPASILYYYLICDIIKKVLNFYTLVLKVCIYLGLISNVNSERTLRGEMYFSSKVFVWTNQDEIWIENTFKSII